jgi:hypothetical protein
MPEEPTTGWRLWHLRAGDKIRIIEGGPVRQVTRVSPSAAYYEVIKESTYEVFDRKAGEDKEITRKERKVEYLSAYSFVEMIERGPIKAVTRVVETPKEVTPQVRPELPPIEYRKTRRGKR